MENALIFNIQRYSLHDGGGIRTVVFFKGCPLICPWCSNPESQSFKREVIVREGLCIKCSSEDPYKCINSPLECPTGAIEYVGKEYSIKEVIDLVKRDMIFYDSTKGGVTLSGGEPLCQVDFCIELLKKLKMIGINTAIETTGMGDIDKIKEIAKYLDTVLWDFKIMNSEIAKKEINQDIKVMKNNFIEITKQNVNVIPRIPLIPGYTDNEENIKKIIQFVIQFEITKVHILPFHQYGSSKYKGLKRDYKLLDLEVLEDERVKEIKAIIETYGVEVIIGG
ncbi:glycyl-radical enzyme activating protein [Clostridium uliginosum]|uniref:Pyruvate formate lyase activating enzyme n=1 Tax=Clostridium uliginosum TaxID=119641 RepID=A0A1I1HI79_9CLOT|nr:glycyl-radical enzyme activating protein [Clostridium uliginosum]SFC20810.1 pyruvate formate lyase activating enzyme [Clostridium uliginosum]